MNFQKVLWGVAPIMLNNQKHVSCLTKEQLERISKISNKSDIGKLCSDVTGCDDCFPEEVLKGQWFSLNQVDFFSLMCPFFLFLSFAFFLLFS